ncbi:MAG: hypothetical protein D4S01_01300 [Dehalococcoidia bacterium]|nr:MAG: hypothetical protein D4S01_01300 [Dehalococcoidia bacterium]
MDIKKLNKEEREKVKGIYSKLTKDEKKEFWRKYYSKYWWKVIEHGHLKIKTKDMKLVTLVPNLEQQELIDMIIRMESRKELVRIIIPKARQMGISTITEAMLYCKTAFSENVNSLIIADENAKSKNIFEMSKLMHELMPSEIKPHTKRSNAIEIVFDEIHSKITIASAENTASARSGTYHNFHGSEVAFFKDAATLMTGVNQTIPDIPNTTVILESTGNGVGDYFHKIIQDSRKGKNDFRIFFIPWYRSIEYTKPIPDDEKFEVMAEGMYGNEVYYRDTFNLTNEQLNWRRHKIRNKLNGDIRMFMQEYPASIEECFLVSGYNVFNLQKLDKIELNYTREPSYSAIINDMNEFQKELGGYINVWADPIDGWSDRYCIFADTGGMWEKADYSCAAVFDRIKREVVLTIHGHFSASDYAKYLIVIAKKYSSAKLAIEINKWSSETDEQGISVLEKIKSDLAYSNMYRRRVYDSVNKIFNDKVGFFTSSQTKQMIVTNLTDFVNNYSSYNIGVNDYNIVNEMRTYIVRQSKTGKTYWEAQEGKKDDRIMMFGGCLIIDKEMPEPRIKKQHTVTDVVISQDLEDFI